MRKIVLYILLIVFLSTGCSIRKDVKEEINQVTIMPSDLFEGSLKKLEPHLNLTSGCVKVDYKGDKKVIGVKYEIWKEGELFDSNNDVLSSAIKDGFNGDISFSVEEVRNDEHQVESLLLNSVISSDVGYSKSSLYIDSYPSYSGRGDADLQEEIKVSDTEEIIIWGIAANDGKHSSYQDINKTLKKADWALVMKVFFIDDYEY